KNLGQEARGTRRRIQIQNGDGRQARGASRRICWLHDRSREAVLRGHKETDRKRAAKCRARNVYPQKGTGCERRMSVRKRTWTTGKGEKSAWVVDYVDTKGKRRLKSFKLKKEA